MNREFMEAMQQLALERGVSTEEVLEAFKEALRKAYLKRQKGLRKEDIDEGKGPVVDVYIDPQTGRIEMVEVRTVVEKVEDPDKEIALADALQYDPEVQVGDEMEFPIDPEGLSRMAIQELRQMLTQRLKESERNRIYNEYKDKEGQVLTGVVTRVDNRGNVFVELGRGEAYLPKAEQIPTEKYHPGQRIKVYLKKVDRSAKGPSLLVSRAHEKLLEHLLKQEVPEIAEGIVEVKAIAREPGRRSKVAVTSHNPNVDPIGACIGHKGQRIQAVSAELGREKVDIILWSKDPKEFIRNALSPAQVGSIELDPEKKVARVKVSKDQHSLAIGAQGQNVRLASKLTGYEIQFEEAEISDLDEALRRAAEEEEEAREKKGREAFEKLFRDLT
ncbi:transcription termination factor NusA [Thermus oshimai]|jgi:N utilization substance protein A|uniref:Transcription termination/antitermination protein NusA n=1 Tax=Thermus oshimai JL-2 TaxID=751945 RepID=K7QUZ7_THEOS|nr:transcription termination factor NusA [Thermus oshimai]AFV76211.1 transcription termination factor NusA [Thermus oshimai JL-2]